MTTVQQLADYFAWHVKLGRGDWSVEVDWRSLICDSNVCQYGSIRPSPPERMIGQGKVVHVDAVMDADRAHR